jgi:hypothetical protein
MNRHPGFWCRTTLHHRSWSFGNIQYILGEPDMIDDNRRIVGNYYKIERVMTGEKRRDAKEEMHRRLDLSKQWKPRADMRDISFWL